MSAPLPSEIVKQFFACLGSGRMDDIVKLFADDGTIDMPGSSHLPWAGRWTGKEKLEEYFVVMPAALDIRGATQSFWAVDGNLVVVTGTEHGASRVSGKEYQAKWNWLFVVESGKIKLWDAYEDTEAMFNAGPWR
ncbi:nuclear transport factor 2 family protein [Aminobacter niigataensis]|uniref:nuclear transport factor 2 family protein n=1 Tax=Aminobacter niigataensis TaxID=83265 RepID=UPI0024CAC2B7|nr:nuclear transport factor 2 family protein [Aminobacter niigataensis]CAI2931834.1 SnoaL-like domain-containing protein [Aminobacter niigataensis]